MNNEEIVATKQVYWFLFVKDNMLINANGFIVLSTKLMEVLTYVKSALLHARGY